MFSVIFFDLGVIGVDLKRAFQFFGVLKKSHFWGVLGVFGGFWSTGSRLGIFGKVL